jgi:hypothetical protein
MKRLAALGEISQKEKRLNGLFRLMENPILWYEAYANIYSNEGATTKGVDGSTLDGFSENRVASIIARLKDGSYRFQPVRRVYVPKKNGKKRPLGISSGDDKLVQEVVRSILERIYEPVFDDSSHGFRPGRSPHTALQHIEHEWTAVKWIIDMDIQSYFDSINHDLLMVLLEKKIEDKRFLRIIQMMLDAGYLEDWTYHVLTTVYNCAQIKLTDPRDGSKLWERLFNIPTGDGHDQEQDSEYDTRISSPREVYSRHCDPASDRQKYGAQVFAPSRTVRDASPTAEPSFQT